MDENYSRKIFDPLTGEMEDLKTGYNCITGARATKILEMALSGKIPGSDFSDYELSVWSGFNEVLRNAT